MTELPDFIDYPFDYKKSFKNLRQHIEEIDCDWIAEYERRYPKMDRRERGDFALRLEKRENYYALVLYSKEREYGEIDNLDIARATTKERLRDKLESINLERMNEVLLRAYIQFGFDTPEMEKLDLLRQLQKTQEVEV